MKKLVQQKKLDASKALFEKLATVQDVFFTEYHGLTVEHLSELRKELYKEQATFSIVKNSVAKIAFKQANKLSGAEKYFTGPTAVAFTYGNESGPAAKVLANFAKTYPALVLKGGLVNNEEYDAEKIKNYSTLPTRIDLIGMLARTLNEPIAQLARALQALADQKNS